LRAELGKVATARDRNDESRAARVESCLWATRRSGNIAIPLSESMERLAHAPLTCSGFTYFFALQLFKIAVAADFLNNPQRNPGVTHLTQGGATEAVGGGSLDAGSRERFSQNLVRARRGANASNGGSGDGRGINK